MAVSLAKRPRPCRDVPNPHDISLVEICDWRKPGATAIEYHELNGIFTKITYAQLNAARITVSNILHDAKSSQFVGIASDIPAYCLPGLMLGIMSSGRAFVCLPSSGVEAKRISDKLNISHIFSSQKISEIRVIQDFSLHSENIFITQSKDLSTDSDEYLPHKDSVFAYATTTSGTTGEPKIVRVTHSSIVPNILDLKRILKVSERDIIAQNTPLSFDPSIIEIFMSLSNNATLFMASGDLKNDPDELLKILVKTRVSIFQSTPSLLLHRWSSEVLRKSLLGKNTDLRILLLGGEDFPSEKVLSRIRSVYNETRIFDIYGITEVSCWASIREIRGYDFASGLGETMSETILEVRNEEGQRVQEGEGILYIGSNSRICVIDDEDIRTLSSPVFRDTGDTVVIHQDGRVNLKGRRGRRIKRYGTKVYLKDLENHVQQLSYVENCYALFTESNQSLHLYFTIFNKFPSEGEKIKFETEVSGHTTKLPDIYRPDKIALLGRFELTSNGKICKNFLKKLSAKLTRDAANNRDELKTVETFENIWKRFLPSEGESGFLDRGGSSVIALRIANELEDITGHEFPQLMGYLLRNENFNTCREYISGQSSNFSHTVRDLSVEKSSKSIETFVKKSSESIKDYGKQKESPEKILPWQKCRGRSDFPILVDSKREKAWSRFTKIRLENRYDLGKCVDASPTIFSYPGGKSYVTVGSHAGFICTAELRKGNSVENWKVSLPNRIEASILVVNDFRGIVGSYDTFVYCIDLKTGEQFWKFKTNDIVKCTAVLCSRKLNVFFGSYDRKAYCVSLKDGSEVWSVQAGNGSICATPCTNDELDCVLFATLDGTCVSLKQNSGEINWLHRLDHPVFSAPIILDTGLSVFCDISGKINSISLATGQRMWSIKIDGNIFSHLLVNTDLETRLQSLLFASENKNAYRIECSSERPIFRFTKSIGAPIASTPSTNGRIIVVAGNDGNLKILDFLNGEILYNFELGADVFSSPIVHENFIAVGCRDNHLYVLSGYDVD